MSVCNVATNDVGSVIRLTRVNVHTGCGWFVECSSIETASALQKNLRACPSTFFQIEFRFEFRTVELKF